MRLELANGQVISVTFDDNVVSRRSTTAHCAGCSRSEFTADMISLIRTLRAHGDPDLNAIETVRAAVDSVPDFNFVDRTLLLEITAPPLFVFRMLSVGARVLVVITAGCCHRQHAWHDRSSLLSSEWRP